MRRRLPRRRRSTARPSGSASSGCTWRRTPARRCTSAAPPAASTAPTESLVDYNRAGIPLVEIVTKPVPGTGRAGPGGGPGLRHRAARRDARRSASPTCGWSRARCAATSTSRSNRPGEAVGHPHRDQERQLAALGRAGGPLRDHPAGRRARRAAAGSCRRPGTSTRTPATPRRGGARRRRPTTGTSPSPTWCRWRRTRPGWSELRADAAGAAGASAGRRLQRAGGWPTEDMQSMVNAGAVELIEATVAAGAPAGRGPQVVAGRAGPAGQRARRRARPSSAITPAQVAELSALVDAGHAQRQAGPAGARRRARAGEGSPTEVMAARGLRRRLRRRRADRGGRRGDRRQPGRRREDPRRQGRRGRRARRRGHEGDPRARPTRRPSAS